MRGRMLGCIKRADRDPVSIGATVHMSTGSKISVTIVDVSQGGCQVRCSHALPIGEIVQLEAPSFQLQVANIRWCVGDMAGLRFI